MLSFRKRPVIVVLPLGGGALESGLSRWACRDGLLETGGSYGVFRRGRRPRLRGCGEGGNAAASVGPRAYRHPQKVDDDSWGGWAVKRATLAVRGRWRSLTTRAPTEGYRSDSVRARPARTRRSRARPRRTWAASGRRR